MANLRFMNIDLSQPARRVRPLAEAQALIDQLWELLRAFVARNEEQAQLLAKQAQLLEKQARIIDEQARCIAALEEKLRTNSSNSSTPPAADPHRPKAPKPSTGKKRGAQPGHLGKARALLPPEQVTHAHDCQPGVTFRR